MCVCKTMNVHVWYVWYVWIVCIYVSMYEWMCMYDYVWLCMIGIDISSSSAAVAVVAVAGVAVGIYESQLINDLTSLGGMLLFYTCSSISSNSDSSSSDSCTSDGSNTSRTCDIYL